MSENVNKIKEIIREEVAKYKMDEVTSKQDDIKKAILTRVQELFQSDFIIDVSFGDMVLS
jgi:flagellar FliL protein